MKSEQKEKQKNEEVLDLIYEPSEKDVFDEVILALKEYFIATFWREDDTSLRIRFTNKQEFRVTLQEIF